MKETIEKFYTAFAAKDTETMISCYTDDIHFEDPAFGILKGPQVGNMWRMLCESQKGKEFIITFSDVTYDDEKGTAHWEAKYHFSKTGRKVHNKIDATFEFRNGKISKHIDHFNLHKWASQALGLSGKLIGWTSFFRKKLQTQTHALLTSFESKIS